VRTEKDEEALMCRVRSIEALKDEMICVHDVRREPQELASMWGL
jgi:hypothetical protein